MKAVLSNYRQSPRKVGLVAGLIRGKTVREARMLLKFANKRAALPVLKLLESAVSNAKNIGVDDVEALKVQEIQVNKGMVLKRIMPRARGSAARINKRSSHVSIILAGAEGLIQASGDAEVVSAKKVATKTAKSEKKSEIKKVKKS